MAKRPTPAPAAGPYTAALVRELAATEDWRARVAVLGLSEHQARKLRVEVLRERTFRSLARSVEADA